ncbi:MAG: NUDIX hydrolase [Thermogutta sp.]|nr:NUDIX hydrolase [Thermogutta sp.]
MPFTYQYPRPAVCVDCVVFGVPRPPSRRGRRRIPGLSVLLIRRLREPFAGRYALPGGFVEIDEPLEAAARRELVEETGITPVQLLPVGMYGDPGRDPRGRTISAVFRAVVWKQEHPPTAGDDADAAAWFPLRRLPALAFDHDLIVRETWQSLRRAVRGGPCGAELLPSEFEAETLAWVYRAMLGRWVEADKLLAQLQRYGLIRQAAGGQKDAAVGRYRWNPASYRKQEKLGFDGLGLGL